MRDPEHRPRWPTRDMRGPVPVGRASFTVDLGSLRVRIEDLPTPYEPFVREHYAPFADESAPREAAGLKLRCSEGEGLVLPLPPEGEPTRLEITRTGSELRVSSHFADARVRPVEEEGDLLLTDRTWDRFSHSLENVLRVLAQDAALEKGQVFVHAAAVLDDERAILFAAPSGEGKSTLVGLSGSRPALTDDLALVDLGGPEPRLVSAPFHPAEPPERRRRGSWPIGAVLRIRQAREDRLERLSPAVSVASLGALVPYAADLGVGPERLTPLLARLVRVVPVFDAHFTRSPRVWDLLSHEL